MDLPSTIYDIPFLDETTKRKLLGWNAQKLFNLDPVMSEWKLEANKVGWRKTMQPAKLAAWSFPSESGWPHPSQPTSAATIFGAVIAVNNRHLSNYLIICL